MSELGFDEAARITEKLRKHQGRMEWMSLLFGQMLEQAKAKRVWVAMDYPADSTGWDRYCKLELGIGGDSEANDLIRIAQLVRQFPTNPKMMLTIGKSKMRLILPHVGQNFETDEFKLESNELGDLLEKAHTMTYVALRNHLNDTPEQEANRYAPPPLSVRVPIQNDGERHEYQVELNPKSGEVLKVTDLNPPSRCYEPVVCKHCGAENWARVGYNHIVEVYKDEPKKEPDTCINLC